MFKTLRILFTILSAICIALVIPIGAFLGWFWAIGCALFALLFFVVMLLCKQSQENQEATLSSNQSTDGISNADEKTQE